VQVTGFFVLSRLKKSVELDHLSGDDRGGPGGFGFLTEEDDLPGAAGGCACDDGDPPGGTCGKGGDDVPLLFTQEVAKLAGPAGGHDGVNAVLYEIAGDPFESLQVDCIVIGRGL
jgi:hypothetical protein